MEQEMLRKALVIILEGLEDVDRELSTLEQELGYSRVGATRDRVLALMNRTDTVLAELK